MMGITAKSTTMRKSPLGARAAGSFVSLLRESRQAAFRQASPVLLALICPASLPDSFPCTAIGAADQSNQRVRLMSARSPRADITERRGHVR